MHNKKRNIISGFISTVLGIVLINFAFSSCERIYEDLAPCPHGVSLRFIYDYNMEYANAFLFSCFCGLRHCDIIALRWEDIHYDENGNALLSIIQKKTKEAISLPLCSEAIKHLPDRGNAPETEKVFAGLVSLGRSNVILHKWIEQAGISKHVTFHTARHTHATMMLTLGVDLYTVSKLLGHTNIQTTQIYAKLVDESKKKAIDLIPNIS